MLSLVGKSNECWSFYNWRNVTKTWRIKSLLININMALCELPSARMSLRKYVCVDSQLSTFRALGRLYNNFSEIIKQDDNFLDMLVWCKYSGGQGTGTGVVKGMCRVAAQTERYLVICCTLMLTCARGLKLASEVVYHIPTGFYIKALIVLLILYCSKYSVIHFLCTTGVLTDSHLCSVCGFVLRCT